MRSVAFIAGLAAVAALASTFVHTPSVRADAPAGTDERTVSYPEGYRSWTFLHGSLVPATAAGFSKSPCAKPCTNGMFYFYANDLALKGLRTGTYPDGAIIAEELLEFSVNEKGAGAEGRRALTAVMVKDSKRYADTDGWGYGSFDEGSKINTLDANARRNCHSCHVSRKDSGYVFTKYVDR